MPAAFLLSTEGKLQMTGRKIAAKETQEGFVSLLIRNFGNFVENDFKNLLCMPKAGKRPQATPAAFCYSGMGAS